MRTAFLLLGAVILPGGLILVAMAIWKHFRQSHVSEAWMVENDRRDWGSGVDAVCWTWSVNKLRNDAGRFNAAQLRKRA